MLKQVRDLVVEMPKSSLPAGAAVVGGDYPFFISGPSPLRIDQALCRDPAVILSTGGNAAVHYCEGSYSYSTDSWALRPIESEIDGKFLFYFLSSQIDRIAVLGFEGSGLKHLRKGFVRDYRVRSFERREQSKIAEILSTVDRAIDQTEALISKQQRVKTGLMQDLLTHGIDEHGNLRTESTHEFKDSPLGRIPVEWHCSPLSFFVPSAEYGISTSLGDQGCPVLRMNNLKDGEVDLSDLKGTDLPVPERLWLRPGDVLFNRTNSWEHVGRTGIWRGQMQKVTFASYLVRLNPDASRLLPEILNAWLNWQPTQIAMRRFATPAVQQVNINPTNLRAILAAFPGTLDEQRAISERLNANRSALASLHSCLCKIHSLKTGLMQDLLTGKRRVTTLLKSSSEEAAS